MSSRDEFPESVKRAIALRVNNRCSNPSCGASTSGPQLEPERSLNIGVAAHITAASPGGPRYDPNLSEEERASAANGIWLCQNCAKLVDNDTRRFPESVLRRWKETAEAHALDSIGRQSPFDGSLAPKLRVLEDEATAAPRAIAPDLSNSNLIEELSRSIPADVETYHQIELLDRGHGAAGQPYAILGVGRNHGWDWDIIFLCAGEMGWEVVARTAVGGQKGYVPIVLYVPGRPGALVLTHVAGYGTGVFRRSTSWYRIARTEPIPLLTYPLSFYVVGWGMPFDRKLTTKVLSMPRRLQSGAELELAFTIEYSIGQQFEHGSTDSLLFSSEHRLSLDWDDAAGTFVPHTSKDDLGQIDELWNEGTDDWVTRNFAKLKHLALNGTPRQQQFIRHHLLPETTSKS